MDEAIKARKPWHRPRNIVFAILLAFFFLLAYAVFWALTAEPEPTIDYGAELERIALESQAPGENGWPKLVEALEILQGVEASFDAVSRPEEHTPGLGYDALFYADVSPEAVAMIRDAVQRLRERGAFDLLAQAAECPNVVRPWPGVEEGLLIGALLPELAQARRMAKARLASMHIALEDGDMDEVVAAFEQTMALGRICSHQASIIDSLVGQAIANLGSQRLRHALLEHDLDGPTLRRLLDITQDEAGLALMDIGLEGDRHIVLDAIQHTYTDGGPGGGMFLPSLAEAPAADTAPGRPRISNLAGLTFAGRRALTDKTNAFFDEAVRRAVLSRSKRCADPFDEDAFAQGLSRRFFLLKLMIPAIGRAIEMRDGASCTLAGTRLMLAIELYHAENGRYPQNLSELTPGMLPDLPADPYSADGFVYRLMTDDEHGRPYLLYSIGADGEDNDGITDDQQPNKALNMRDGAGLDFVINAPRPVE